jgi:colicin import membrane protein
MIRKHENSQAFKAGVLALVVHLMFFLIMVVSFDWKSEAPLQVTEVELWDSLPVPQAKPLPPPPLESPKPQAKVEDQPPPPKIEEKAEIVVKEKKPEPKPEPKPEKKKEEPPKPDPAELKKKEELKKKAEEKKQQEILRKIQQEALKDDLAQESHDEELKQLDAAHKADQAQRAATASNSVVGDYKERIKQKITGLMNRQACGDKEVAYSISILPTGQISGMPKLVKSSGVPACDDAALRAIMQAQPLPLPPDSELFAKFRDLTIPFTPEP